MAEVKLKTKPTLNVITCVGQDKCTTCPIGPNGSNFCPGCNGHCGMKGASVMDRCHRDCMHCGGGPANPNSVKAICCKSPLRDIELQRVEKDEYKWTKRPTIHLNQKGIIVTQGGVGRIQNPYPKQTEAIAVNLRHVWSGNGWYSRDMKDYLKVPRHVKLLLLTMTHDDVLDRAWESRLHEDDWGAVGFDYWQPLHFSFYFSDAKMNMYWQWRKTLLATEASKGWFTTYVPQFMTRKVDPIMKEMANHIPQVMFNAQFNSSNEDIEYYLRQLVRDHVLFPKSVPFWFVGTSTRKVVRAIKSFVKGRDLYFLATAPWLAGHKGAAFTVTGKSERSSLPKDELVVQNQLAFMEMVQSS